MEGQSLIYAIIRDVSELQYLQTELSWHLSESLLLNRVIASLAATLDKQVIFETICNEIADMLHIEHVTTSMFEPQNESLLIVAEAQHAKSPVFAGKRFLFSQEDPLRALLGQPTSYLIQNGQVEQEFKNLVDFFHPDPAGALLLVPLMFRNHVSGWLTLATQQPRLFQEREMNLVKNVTAAAGQALELTALYQDLQSELEHRRLVEKALAVREQYLEALVDILGLLLRSNQGHIEKSILATLGKVSSASQVSVYINHKDEKGRWFANELVNWTAGEGKDQHPVQKQEIDYEKMAPTWFDQMVRGGVITGKIDDLPPQEQAWLEESHVLSILVLPIFIGGDFFGFIRFDHCAEERQWDPSEISLLHAAAASISMAIERMQAENRMRESQSSLLLMLDQMPAVLWTTDLELNITSIRGSTLAGFAIQSPVTVAGLFPDRIYGENPVFMHYQALSGVPVSFEISNQDRYTQIVLEPFYDANGIIMGTLGLGLDVSERRKMMRELQDSADAIAANSIALAEARDQALEASRLKSEFLATMSHEIRTPMNAVIGMTELLLEQPMNAEQHQYTEVVRDSAQVLLALINDILDFSKIEAGKLELEEVAIDIPALVESVSELFAMKARLKGLHYEVRIAPNFPACLRSDPIRLRQILINLIGNAIKFTETGKIAVQVDRLSESAEAVSLQISVIDSGIGLNEIARRRLFQPFTQADGSTTRKFGGTGLGLAISKSLVELMGGSIGVESEEQRGSTFWFTVSLKRVSDELAASIVYEKETHGLRVTTPLDIQPEFKSGAESGLAGSPAILLAEDNSANQLLAQVQIKKLGYAVDAVQNGEQVVAAVSSGKKKYALILMDCQMPVVDGFEATRLIRELEFKSEGHIPIIAMTANAMQGDRETCLTAGMDDYISKPVTMEALRKTLDYWLMSASYRPVDQNGEEAPAAEPVDDAILEGIRIALEGSDGDLLAEVVNLYLDESALLTDGMRQAIIDKDSTRLRRSAHNLKGSSANLGAGHLASLCLEMQGLAEANRFETAHIHLSQILAECDRVRAALKAKTQK